MQKKKSNNNKHTHENRLCTVKKPYCLIQRVTWLLHLALSCITFTVGQFITFSVKRYYFYGWVNYYI